MLVDGDAYTAAMCVLGAGWHNARVVGKMNTFGTSQVMAWIQRWARDYKSKSSQWKSIAEGSPLGDDYLATMARFGLSKTAKEHKHYMAYHKIGWARALVTTAEMQCLQEGVRARDEDAGRQGRPLPFGVSAMRPRARG